MLTWTSLKDDLFNGVLLLRKGMLTAAVAASQEPDRVKLQFRIQTLERELAEACRALGRHGLMKLDEDSPEFRRSKEWFRLIQEIDAKRAERDKRAAERDAFDREEKQGEP